MLTQNFGRPWIGGPKDQNKASESYWAGKIDQQTKTDAAREICEKNRQTLLAGGTELIACNALSFYNQPLVTISLSGRRLTPYTPCHQLQ